MSAHPSSNRSRIAALITVAVVAMAAFAPPASAATDTEKALRRKINDYRVDKGKSRLKLAPKLVNFAHRQAKEMAEDGRLFHSTTGELTDLARRANCSSIAEIIANTIGVENTLDGLMAKWKSSTGPNGHNTTMLKATWKRIGPGVVSDNGVLWSAVIFCS